MSAIVAIKENGVVYIGADSQVTRGNTRKTLNNPNNYKIWKVRGVENCIMGSVGSFRDSCVIRLMDNLISDYNVFKKHVDYEFVVKKIVPDIKEELRSFGYIKQDDTFEGFDSRFLFVFQDQIYLIGCDGSVIEIDDCVAIGSGESESIGSLLSTEGLSPEERIIKAIKASAANDIYVDYPIILTNSYDTEFKVVTEKNETKYINKLKKEGDKDAI